jgi:phosphoribosyl-ATP pyrophosphohydrolase/phosphoribosyl-AMP cyclohydrolase
MLDLTKLDFEKGAGLVTVVTQDSLSGAVLMVAHADREALERTLASGEMHYHSRRRGSWRKGETSANTQRVVSLAMDCDGDAVLARVVPAGPACHTGVVSCFGDAALAADALAELDRTLAARAEAMKVETGGEAPAPTTSPMSYTQQLLGDRNLRLKKLGEEAAELITACADADRERACQEAADLLYHALVALRAIGANLGDLRKVLDLRAQR